MPIPESHQTREEQYLNAIATGDSSGIPDAPATREEMYLEAIAMSGGGGGGGSASGVLVVHMDVQTGALDKTWQEINDADSAVISLQMDEYNQKYTMPVMYTLAGEHYEVHALMYAEPPTFIAFESDSADGYPVVINPGEI